MEEELSAVHLRLARVTIENLSWQEFLQRYDRKQTFFYCDPPYYKAPYYVHNLLTLDDYQMLADALECLKAKFILSINDTAEIRKIFGSFNLKPVNLNYTVAKKKQTSAKELLVTNF
jgi:DNA adenine methylase